MLLPDVNVLLAGFRTDHIHHRPARAFLDEVRSQTATLALSDVALTSLVRLATNPRVLAQPDTVDAVLDYIDALLDPPAELLTAGAGHWSRFAGCAASSTCGATSSRTPTWRRWRSNNEPSWSPSIADSVVTHG